MQLRDKNIDDKEIPFPDHWDLLGGHVETNESPEECIVREIFEEIEKKLKKPLKPFGVKILDGKAVDIFTQEFNLEAKDITLNEGQRVEWFNHDDFDKLKNVAFGFENVINEFFKKIK